MTTRTLLAAAFATLVLGTGSASHADTASLSAEAPSTRTERRFSLALAATTYFPGRLVGIQAQYHLTDRLALSGQFLVGIPMDAALGVRFFLSPEPRSGLFFDLGAHAMGGFGFEGYGGAGELGYQFRDRSGFLLEASISVLVLHTSEPEYEHIRIPEPSPWFVAPALNLRVGYAF